MTNPEPERQMPDRDDRLLDLDDDVDGYEDDWEPAPEEHALPPRPRRRLIALRFPKIGKTAVRRPFLGMQPRFCGVTAAVAQFQNGNRKNRASGIRAGDLVRRNWNDF